MKKESFEFLILLYEHYQERLLEVSNNKLLLKSVQKHHILKINQQIKEIRKKLLKFDFQYYGIEIPDGIKINPHKPEVRP